MIDAPVRSQFKIYNSLFFFLQRPENNVVAAA